MDQGTNKLMVQEGRKRIGVFASALGIGEDMVIVTEDGNPRVKSESELTELRQSKLRRGTKERI